MVVVMSIDDFILCFSFSRINTFNETFLCHNL